MCLQTGMDVLCLGCDQSHSFTKRANKQLHQCLVEYRKLRQAFWSIIPKQGWSNTGHRLKTQPESTLVCNIKWNIWGWSVPSQSLLSKNDVVGFAGDPKILVSYRHAPVVSQGFPICFTGVLPPQLLAYEATRQHLLYCLSQIPLPLYSSPFIVTCDMQYYFQLYLACM